MKRAVGGFLMILFLVGVLRAAPEPSLPVKYLQRMHDGTYSLIARFVSLRACEKYRAMQAQITCVETSLCKTRPELCKGRPVSSGPISCWHDLDMGPGFGRCE